MISDRLKNLAFTIEPLLTALTGFAVVPLQVEALGIEQFGVFGLSLALWGVHSTLSAAGLTSAFWKYSSRNRLINLRLLGKITKLQFKFSTVGLLCLGTIAWIVYGDEVGLSFLVLGGSTYLLLPYRNALINYQADRDGIGYISLSLLQSFVLLAGTLATLYYSGGVVGVCMAYLISYGVAGLGFYIVSHRGRTETELIVENRELLKYGLPLLAGNLCTVAYTAIDTIVIAGVLGSLATGVYTFALKYGSILKGTVIAGMFVLWNARRWEFYRLDNGREILAHVTNTLLTSLSVIGFGAAGCLILLLSYYYPNPELKLGVMFSGIAIANTILYAYYYINSMGLLFGGQTSQITKVLIYSTILNGAITAILCHRMGIIGAFLATYVSMLFLAIITNLKSQVVYRIEIEPIRQWLGYGGTVLLCGLCAAWPYTNGDPFTLGWTLIALGSIFSLTLLAVDLQSIRESIRYLLD